MKTLKRSQTLKEKIKDGRDLRTGLKAEVARLEHLRNPDMSMSDVLANECQVIAAETRIKGIKDKIERLELDIDDLYANHMSKPSSKKARKLNLKGKK